MPPLGRPAARAAASSAAKTAFSSWRGRNPLARRIALRSHCRPKISSSAPTTRRSASIGMALTAGPSAATAAVRASSPVALPARAVRQPRASPAASTIVTASTPSTAVARKTATNSPASRLTAPPAPPSGGSSSVAEHGRRLVADHPPQGRCPAEAGVIDERVGVELAPVEADRADEELAALFGELAEQVRNGRGARHLDRFGVPRHSHPHRFLGQEHRHPLALVERGDGGEERDRYPLGVLVTGREVDDHHGAAPFCCSGQRTGLLARIVDPMAPNLAALRRVSESAERA